MRISWHITAAFSVLWAVGALLSFAWSMATGEFASLTGSAGASAQLTNSALSPGNVVLNNPSLGEGAGDIEATFSFLIVAKDWTLFAIRSLALDYEFLSTNRWLIISRWLMLAFATPLAINLALLGSELLARMVRGLSSIPIPFIGRFLGG